MRRRHPRKHSTPLPLFKGSAPLAAALLIWTLSAVLSQAHAAGPNPSALLESAIARQILLETQAGEALVTHLAGPSAARLSRAEQLDAALRRLNSAALTAERAELERAVREAELRLERFRSGRPEDVSSTQARIAAEEAAFLEHEAARLLKVAPEWSLPTVDPIAGDIGFVDTARTAATSRARFLAPEPVEPPFRTDVTVRPKTALTRARDFVNKLDECIQSRPADAARAQDLRFMLQGIGISELFTVTGYIAGSGEKEVDWANLPTDVFMTALWGVINSKIVTGAPTLKMRWVRVAFLGQTRSASDAVFYYITPLKDTHGRDPYDATLDRWGYNASWNATTSPIPVALYTLLTGLECIHGAKMAKTAFGIRMATSATTSFAYFKLRNHFVGNEPRP